MKKKDKIQTEEFDLCVIGGGSGGVRAARVAAQLGAKVALAESYRMGGTCVIRGCVPKKLLSYASQYKKDLQQAQYFGWECDVGDFNMETFYNNKHKYIAKLEAIYENLLKSSGVTIFNTHAKVTSPNTVLLEDISKEISTKYILIATGAKPFVPKVEGSSYAITSNEFFLINQKPKSITIFGGGYIAVEFACIAKGLGIATHLVYRGQRLLKDFDYDITEELTKSMLAQGINIQLQNNVTKLERHAHATEVTTHLANGGKIVSDLAMFATGRVPNIDNLGLEEVGIKTDAAGAIIVDKNNATNIDNVYAIGDVINHVQLTPVAIRQGQFLVERLFSDKQSYIDYSSIPTAVFSNPEIGVVGLTEEQARKQYGSIKIYKTQFKTLKDGFSEAQGQVLMKLVVSTKDNKILGCHMLGKYSAEIIQVVAIAIKLGVTKDDFDNTLAVHPTVAEELVTLK